MIEEERSKLVRAWIAMQKAERGTARHDDLFWSVSNLWELTHKEPDTALDVILTILQVDDSSKIQENLSAGPLEDLLVYHGPKMIERIEREASRNHSFRMLLGGVWKNVIADEIWSRIQMCWNRTGWDGIPE